MARAYSTSDQRSRPATLESEIASEERRRDELFPTNICRLLAVSQPEKGCMSEPAVLGPLHETYLDDDLGLTQRISLIRFPSYM